MRRKKREHLNDYELNEKGEYVYRGQMWRWESPEARTRTIRAEWLFSGAGLAFLIAAGFVPASGVGSTFFVLIPYVLAVVVDLVAMTSLWKLAREGEQVREYLKDTVSDALAGEFTAMVILCCAASIGQLVCMATSMGLLVDKGLGLAFLLCLLASGACAFCAVRTLQQLRFVKE